MILGTTTSINGVRIRLTDERWEHFLDEHPNEFSFHAFAFVLDVVEDPDYILRGQKGTLVAVVPDRGEFLHVIYREVTPDDGFVITAYYRTNFHRDRIIWRKYENSAD